MAFLRIAAAVQSVLTEGQNRLFGKHADSLILKLGIIFICSAAIVGLLESFSPNV
jgi:hypothetical protein